MSEETFGWQLSKYDEDHEPTVPRSSKHHIRNMKKSRAMPL